MEGLSGRKNFSGRLARLLSARSGVAALLALAALAPFLVRGDYYVQLCTEILIASLLAISLNFLIGFTGLVSLGHAVYLGVGAYAFALTTKNAYPSMWGSDWRRRARPARFSPGSWAFFACAWRGCISPC